MKKKIYTDALQQFEPNKEAASDNWARYDTYDNFTNKLFILHPSITKMELRICLLLKIKIPVSTISQLVCRTQSAVSMSRKQLYKKIFNKEGTPANLDDFIVSF